jgi:hypothetical protein
VLDRLVEAVAGWSRALVVHGKPGVGALPGRHAPSTLGWHLRSYNWGTSVS